MQDHWQPLGFVPQLKNLSEHFRYKAVSLAEVFTQEHIKDGFFLAYVELTKACEKKHTTRIRKNELANDLNTWTRMLFDVREEELDLHMVSVGEDGNFYLGSRLFKPNVSDVSITIYGDDVVK